MPYKISEPHRGKFKKTQYRMGLLHNFSRREASAHLKPFYIHWRRITGLFNKNEGENGSTWCRRSSVIS